jgi:hypothetical protein
MKQIKLKKENMRYPVTGNKQQYVKIVPQLTETLEHLQERCVLRIPHYPRLRTHTTVTSQEETQHVSPEYHQRGVITSRQEGHQHLTLEHTRLGTVFAGPSQKGHQHLTPEHTRRRRNKAVESGKKYQHPDAECTLTVPCMEEGEQQSNESPELVIEVKNALANRQPSEGSDKLPTEYLELLAEEKLFKDAWAYRNVLSGLDLYEMFKMCHENEGMCMFGQESHVPQSLPPVQTCPVILVCPLRLHPALFCPWLGFQNDRHQHMATDHRDFLIKGTSVELKVNGLALLSALNEVFVCYTLLEIGILYCIVQHACYYKACNSDFYYVTEHTDVFTGVTVTQRAAVATTFQTFAFLKDTDKCVSYRGIEGDHSVKVRIYSP